MFSAKYAKDRTKYYLDRLLPSNTFARNIFKSSVSKILYSALRNELLFIKNFIRATKKRSISVRDLKKKQQMRKIRIHNSIRTNGYRLFCEELNATIQFDKAIMSAEATQKLNDMLERDNTKKAIVWKALPAHVKEKFQKKAEEITKSKLVVTKNNILRPEVIQEIRRQFDSIIDKQTDYEPCPSDSNSFKDSNIIENSMINVLTNFGGEIEEKDKNFMIPIEQEKQHDDNDEEEINQYRRNESDCEDYDDIDSDQINQQQQDEELVFYCSDFSSSSESDDDEDD